jgi:prepilin-type processing-associated H-X9-DG protein
MLFLLTVERLMTIHTAKARKAITLLELLVALAIIGILAGLLLAAVQATRAAAARLACQNNMRQHGLALHMYHDAQSTLPPGTTHPSVLDSSYGPEVAPYQLLSWGGRLLPHLEQLALWRTVEAYYANPDDANIAAFKAALSSPLKVFLCPSDFPPRIRPLPPGPAETSNYFGVAGRSSGREDGCLFLDSTIRFAQITDGLSNTLLVGERPINDRTRGGRWQGGWGYWGTADSFLGVQETALPTDVCPLYPYPYQRGDKADPCAAFHFWSFHPSGANWLFADGCVRFLSYGANDALPALATREGGESVEAP